MNNVYVVDFETTTIQTDFWKNQIPSPHPFKENELCKYPRVLLWCLRKIDFEIDGNQSIPFYFYNFIENTKLKKLKDIKEVRGKRQEEAYDFKGFVVGNNEKSFIDFILNLNANSHFIFHNLSFDGTYIVQMFNELNKYGFDEVHFTKNDIDENGIKLDGIEYIKTKNKTTTKLKPNYWNAFRNGSDIYRIDLCKMGVGSGYSNNKIYISFSCSANLLSSSVSKLGESLSDDGAMFNKLPLQKLYDDEIDLVLKPNKNGRTFYDVEPMFDKSIEEFYKANKEFVEYCCRDVEIVVRSLKKFEKVINMLPTIHKHNISIGNKNKRIKETSKTKYDNRKNQYRTIFCEESKQEIGYISIYEYLTIAGMMRELMETIYVKDYQNENIEYGYYNVWSHLINDEHIEQIKKEVIKPKSKQKINLPIYKSLTKIEEDDHKFIKEVKDIYNNQKFSGLYRGGFTQFSSKYQVELENLFDIKDGMKLDVSSAYPYQMTKPLPFGRLISQEEFEAESKYVVDDNNRQIYINDVNGLTYKDKSYSKYDGCLIKSKPIMVGGYKHLLNDKSKYYVIHTLYMDWIQPKNKDDDPTQFAKKVPFFPAIDKDEYEKILLSDKHINDLYNSFESTARYEPKRQEKIIIQLWDFEWEFVKKYYDFKLNNQKENCDEIAENSNEIMYMLACPFLKKFSEELYAKKDEYSIKKDSSGKLSTKIALNSSYGSLAIKPQFDSTFYLDKASAKNVDKLLKEFRGIKDKKLKDDLLTISTIKNQDSNKINRSIIKGKSQSINTNYEAYSFFEIKEKKKSPYNIYAASCITALQRVYLLETIERIGPQYFAYSDTDSIIFCNINQDTRNKLVDLSKQKRHDFLNIGMWEIEIYKLIGFHTTKAKDYVQAFKKFDVKENSYYNEKKVRGYFDENNNWVKPRIEKIYCSEKEAKIYYKFVSSGLTIPQDNDEKSEVIRKLKTLTIKEREKMSDDDFDDLFKCFDNDYWKEILSIHKNKSSFYQELRRGGMVIPYTNLQKIPFIYENGQKIYVRGGTILDRKTKETRFGRQ